MSESIVKSVVDPLEAARQDGNASPSTGIAFIVHNPSTLTNGLPPDVDNKPLARQKRRRTSPEDQTVLETEYLRNPKPDKAARMEIVSKVALGEKEVQIWFQNRRQASRRKSRPLEPHEIAAYQSRRSLDASNRLVFSSLGSGPLDTTAKRRIQYTQPLPFDSSQSQLAKGSTSLEVSDFSSGQGRHEADVTPTSSASTMYSTPGSSQSQGPTEYLVNRRLGYPTSNPLGADASPPTSQETQADLQMTRRELRRTTSKVRLSMTDGIAKVVTKNDSSPTPSPPRKIPSPAPKTVSPGTPSEASFATFVGSTISRPAVLTRKPSNRARDSRAWEFWADKGSRTELVDKANQEARGSAADAIGLLRSASGRSILGQLTGKRAGPHGSNEEVKRPRRGPLLQRSQSMQNKPLNSWRGSSLKTGSSPRKFKKAQSGLGIQILATDSDKENWSPDPSVSHAGDDGMPRSGSDNDDTKQERPGRYRARSTVTPGKLLVSIDHATAELSSDGEDDAEISSFMNGGGRARQEKSNSVSEEEELDCVQGLLSLSQGAWK